ncbi:MAG: 50S ribosomal protein L1 [Candidatus Omnitrophica bacterium]|nr:50S ribosomal protein L1 [Candidatus Omnitrophota bacterium]MDD5429172.1 50S ribosomal protein L1 [Candidatus Omnitrophota bacterium]
MVKSKRYRQAREAIDIDKVYSLEEAVNILKSIPHTKFDETVEISGKLGADPKQSDQMVRGSVVLPNGTGRKMKVLVFCEPEKEKDAKTSGADYIGSEEVIDKILKDGWLDFDCCISTPSQMRMVSKLGKFLGPRGLMPSPKNGTVTENISYAVQEAKRGKIDFRMDKLACIHVGVGKVSFSKEALIENIRVFLDALVASRPASVKGDFIKNIYLSATMSPSIRITV